MVWLGFPEKTITTDLGTVCSGACKPADQGTHLHDTHSKNSIYFHWKVISTHFKETGLPWGLRQ